MTHTTGSLSSYVRGCRCDACRNCAAEYNRARLAKETPEQKRKRLDRKAELQRQHRSTMTIEQRRKIWGGKPTSQPKQKQSSLDDFLGKCEKSLSGWHVWLFDGNDSLCGKCNATKGEQVTA